ncbi:MAG TPA: methylenetetrahydrofolate--tRNA-(uracil(54)-C(5))-methyltransferase (FADH(2)-oxidizing) TrmFO [Chitinivibrionales bacterium]|nr:methylenetetrahydrofolate--tRNA-(uracil(54)-C(5))-methyltransferase (FADH(2)-oxidizing) TrmFO [Chitinivibrionales bacterium]
MPSIGIIGAGLAGCEAALVLVRRGIAVTLYEMRPAKTTAAHATALPAELVCSNSFKSQELPAALALLKEELALLGSPLLSSAKKTSLPAGKALAVDRKAFSEEVMKELKASPGISLQTAEAREPPAGHDAVILATGPLTSLPMAEWLQKTFPADSLYFYDAIAPIVSRESIDFKKAFFGSRWRLDRDDYCNCPFTREEYERFHGALKSAQTVSPHAGEEERFFEACLPLDIIARRGPLAMAYGPLKPVGFSDPSTGKRPFALCQLRREDAAGSSFSLVACQTRLTQAEQKRVFRMIPGLENAEFLRFGSCHRNTYLDSPSLLAPDLSFKSMPSLFCAGQLCGNEGYVESIATGHAAAKFVLGRIRENHVNNPPETTALGSLLHYVTGSKLKPFSPSSFHFGLLPALSDTSRKLPKKERQMQLCHRAIDDMKTWIRAADKGD